MASRKSPERSPVNTRPVRFPLCAAGARPRRKIRAAGSPKPATGRPQYDSPAQAARFSRHPLAPLDEAGASPALGDLPLQADQPCRLLALGKLRDQAFSLRPLVKSHWAQRYVGMASAAVTARHSATLVSLVPRNP